MNIFAASFAAACAFAIGLEIEWHQHRRVCLCDVCREWREEVRKEAQAKLLSVDEPPQNPQGTEGGEK